MTRKFGLIGYPLSHSFSKKYFTAKFASEGIEDAQYDLYPLPDVAELPKLVANTPGLVGLNVTIPHKQAVLPYLSAIDPAAQRIGAVNVLKVSHQGELTGYNSDYFGFRLSLEKMLDPAHNYRALVLGTGGASKAVVTALADMQIPYQMVSRNATDEAMAYSQLTPEILAAHLLVVNTTPLGMSPKVDECPPLPYESLSPDHILYDLVYNPETTLFMKMGQQMGAKVANGLEMLYLQAEKSWEIWNR